MLADAAERRELIVEGLNAAGEWIDPMGKLDEVVHLVEWPTVLEGRFDERYLELPERVPITAMQSHQRYFPIVRDGRLDARFAFVANGGDPAVVAAGNEEVLVGRLEDAVFAHDKDQARGIAAMLAELPRVSFLEGAGSLADKAERVREISRQLCDRVEVEPPLREAVARAAELCKADLVSSLVAEFSDLQGYAGSLYARDAGEPPEVCEAIADHHLPIEAGGALPADEGAALLSVSDKADTVAVAFALGAQPTGSRDPYGLRRAAAGIVAIALERGYELGLVDLMAESVHMLVSQGHELRRKPLEAVPDAVDFVLDRVEPLMAEEGVTVDEMRAARGSGVTGPLPLAALCRALRDARGADWLAAVRDAYGRCIRITAKAAEQTASEVRTSLFEMDEERGAVRGADGGRHRDRRCRRAARLRVGAGRCRADGGADQRVLRAGDGDGRGSGPAREPSQAAGRRGLDAAPGRRLRAAPWVGDVATAARPARRTAARSGSRRRPRARHPAETAVRPPPAPPGRRA